MNHKIAFRILLDYVQSFDTADQYRSKLLWCPNGKTRRGSDYTDVVLSHMVDHTLQLGILPDDQHNEWDDDTIQTLLQQFKRSFDIEQLDKKNLEPIGTEPELYGTAQAILRHICFTEYTIILRFLKRIALHSNQEIFLVDNEGHSVRVKHCKRIKLFTLEFMTNIAPMKSCLKTSSSTYKKSKKRKARVVIMDDHDIVRDT